MVFSSIDFIFKFLPIFLIVYGWCPEKWKNTCLFAGSLIFYSYGIMDTPCYLLLFLLSILVNYKIGLRIGREKRQRKRKAWMFTGIGYDLFWLFLFKYMGFASQNFNTLLRLFGCEVQIPVFQTALPIGLSFYTFQQISYLIDVYRKETDCEVSLVNYGMYISMFPQLIAGPIVTYSSIREQIEGRERSAVWLEEGLREFTIGLGLKVLLANQIGGLWREVEKIGFESISTPLAWLALAAYSLQIYFDFYGYSLMARGLGYLLGFHLPRNFSHPYMSLSMTEFWRRWHMTLGSWFKEYVYIPLGGNREGFGKTVRNLFVVWLLTGLWHGASWNFVLWGLALFILIVIEKMGLGKILHRFTGLGHIYMLFMIPLTWMLFAITDLQQLGIYLQRLFPFWKKSEELLYFTGDFTKYLRLYAVSLGTGMIFMTCGPRRLYQRFKDSPISALFLVVIFWVCIYCIRQGMDDPFLYFRF